MSTDINKYTPLKTVVSYALDEMDKSYADFDKAWLLGLRALVDMNFDISAEPKTVRLDVLANKTVNFPTDLISWTKVGLLDSHGKLSTLKINNGLTTWMDNNPNRLAKLQTSEINTSTGWIAGAPYYYNYYLNGSYYNLFGEGNGLVQYGECRIDEKNQLIVLSPDFKYDSILLEYISSPERDSDYKVETALQEAVIAFIKWKMKQGTMQEYYGMVTAGRRRLGKKKVTLQEVNQFIRESSGFKLRS